MLETRVVRRDRAIRVLRPLKTILIPPKLNVSVGCHYRLPY
jgi:hypothetical protein